MKLSERIKGDSIISTALPADVYAELDRRLNGGDVIIEGGHVYISPVELDYPDEPRLECYTAVMDVREWDRLCGINARNSDPREQVDFDLSKTSVYYWVEYD